jgi:carbon monoxide dehydrogenase subunit G
MFARSTPLGLRASATAGARCGAPVAAVWALLADPARWSDFQPCVESVTPAPDQPDAEAPLAAGRRYLVKLRFLPVDVPVEIDHVVDRSALSLSAHVLPGLVEELEFLLMPGVEGGSVVTVRLTLHGPFAVAAIGPRWLARSVSARLLARAAARESAAAGASMAA